MNFLQNWQLSTSEGGSLVSNFNLFEVDSRIPTNSDDFSLKTQNFLSFAQKEILIKSDSIAKTKNFIL